MLTLTTPQAMTIKELSSALRAHMAEIGYRPRTIQCYGYVLQELEDYCEAHNISAFTTELGNQFAWERYGMKLGDQFTSKTVNHVLQMIADYQRQGKISKRYRTRNNRSLCAIEHRDEAEGAGGCSSRQYNRYTFLDR